MTDIRALLSKLTRAELEVLYSAVDSDIERRNRPRVGPRVEILRGVREQLDEARRAAAAGAGTEAPDYDAISALPNWHTLMELVTEVAQEPADHAVEAGLMGMVDFLVERGWTIDRIKAWLTTKEAGRLPWAVVDGNIEPGGEGWVLGQFATEELATKFATTLPDFVEGRYGVDGPR